MHILLPSSVVSCRKINVSRPVFYAQNYIDSNGILSILWSLIGCTRGVWGYEVVWRVGGVGLAWGVVVGERAYGGGVGG